MQAHEYRDHFMLALKDGKAGHAYLLNTRMTIALATECLSHGGHTEPFLPAYVIGNHRPTQ